MVSITVVNVELCIDMVWLGRIQQTSGYAKIHLENGSFLKTEYIAPLPKGDGKDGYDWTQVIDLVEGIDPALLNLID